jgi:hypothetical protein
VVAPPPSWATSVPVREPNDVAVASSHEQPESLPIEVPFEVDSNTCTSAVVVLLQNVTLPSVLENSWCTWPLRQVTEERRR